MSSLKFQGHTAKQKSLISTQIGRFRTATPVWSQQWLRNDTQSLTLQKRCALLFFKVIRQISRSQRKKIRFWPECKLFGLQLKFEFNDGFGMMHTAWRSIEDVSYCFSGSSVKFQRHTGQNSRWFWLDLSVYTLLLQIEFTNGFETMHKAWRSIEEVSYRFPRSSIKFHGHTRIKRQFRPEMSVSGVLLQFEFTNSFVMTQKAWRSIEKDFFEVIHQISRSHGLKNRRFEVVTRLWLRDTVYQTSRGESAVADSPAVSLVASDFPRDV